MAIWVQENKASAVTSDRFARRVLSNFSVQPLCLCASVVKEFFEKQPQRHRDTKVAQRNQTFRAKLLPIEV